jgi:chaperone modulatory protein CbpM
MENLISIIEFCNHQNIEISFVSSLHEFGLIQITTVEQSPYISANDLHRLEKMVRLHYDLDINLEGIETITHMLDRMDDMHREIVALKNRLRLYEG